MVVYNNVSLIDDHRTEAVDLKGELSKGKVISILNAVSLVKSGNAVKSWGDFTPFFKNPLACGFNFLV